MANQGFFGEYNNIYFLTEGGKISRLCDRAHRKRPVYFAEEDIEDLADEPRELSKFSFGGTIPDWLPDGKTRFPSRTDTRTIETAGSQFTVTGQTHTSDPAGFGLGLKYQVIAPEGDLAAVLLTVKLPDRVRYLVHWEPISREGPRFVLPENMAVTVLTQLSWDFKNTDFTVETESEGGEVTFLVESFFESNRVQQTVILTVKGREGDALLARAACGGGFVPCFVVDASPDIGLAELTALLREIPYRLVFSIGLPAARGLGTPDIQVIELDDAVDLQAEVARLFGQPSPARILIAPDLDEAYGPALLLAIRHGASLRLEKELTNQMRLEDAEGCCEQQWIVSDLHGVALDPPTAKNEAVSPRRSCKEIVVCESTKTDLIVCQAIGYADLKGCSIAFLPPVAEGTTRGEFPDGATGIQILEIETAKAVPPGLRAPDVDVITVFTRRLPLHLTPLPDTGPNKAMVHWLDRYVLAHLPGQVASQLVPRLFRERLNEAPSVPFAVIFDALGKVIDTEGHIYANELARGLSHPIVLSRKMARREVLREILRRLDTDLLLLITHGSGYHIEDGVGDTISSTEIAGWTLRGSPIVFNNSCTSWTTTGRAFLSSGARAFIGTLWPVANDIAAKIAAGLGERLHAEEGADASTLLAGAVREVTSEYPNGRETAAAYIYVGLPGTLLLTRPVINTEETIALLAETFQALYNTLNEIAFEGRPDLAVAVQEAVSEALRQRFKTLLIPGELPVHLPWPMSQCSVLDIEFLLAAANFNFGKTILSRLAHEHQITIVAQMDEYLHKAVYELVTWDDRHEKHLGRTAEERNTATEESGMPVGAMGERGFITLAAQMTLNDILPFVCTLADLQEEDAARSWFNTAAKLVTTPADLLPDRSVTDEALIGRIREGIREQMRVLWSPSGDSDRGAWIDHLENAVNKSELANRFGIACLHLKDYERAVAFYRAASDLAEPGSEYFANATSNLSNALRKAKRYDESIDGYQKAFIEQERLQDYRNAIITAANMLRAAAGLRRPIDEAIMQKALAWAAALPVPGERIKHQCDLLGASSCYFASLGKHDQAAVACESISHHLHDPFPVPEVALHLNELVEWYYQTGHYSMAAKLALLNAASLRANLLPDVATRTYLLASQCALRAYNTSNNKRFLSMFFDCSEQIGRALRSSPNLFKDAQLGDWVEGIWENSQSLWKQLADYNERRLALRAYECVKAWDPEREDQAWELLANAYHQRNREAIQTLVLNGSLVRLASLSIDAEMQVVVDVTTRRKDSKSARAISFTEIVYGYLPLYDKTNESSVNEDRVDFVAGVAVYTLRNGESRTVREQNAGAMRTDGQGTFLYKEVWGSRIIPYTLSISLAPGLIPLQMECEPLFGPTPGANIRFDYHGCQIKLEIGTNPQHTAQPQVWLADVRLILRRVPGIESVLGDPEGAFAKEMPFSLYLLSLRLLGSRQ